MPDGMLPASDIGTTLFRQGVSVFSPQPGGRVIAIFLQLGNSCVCAGQLVLLILQAGHLGFRRAACLGLIEQRANKQQAECWPW